jgi:hypothetical protein
MRGIYELGSLDDRLRPRRLKLSAARADVSYRDNTAALAHVMRRLMTDSFARTWRYPFGVELIARVAACIVSRLRYYATQEGSKRQFAAAYAPCDFFGF